MSVPSATLVKSSTVRGPIRRLISRTIRRPIRKAVRWLLDRLEPPHALQESVGFAAASYWSITGALAAGLAIGMYVLCVSGAVWQASVPLAVGWIIFALMGVVFWFWPFLASFYVFQLLACIAPLRTRLGAALYGAGWHLVAHALFMTHLHSDPWTSALLVPALVGALWGSWLPAALDPQRGRAPAPPVL